MKGCALRRGWGEWINISIPILLLQLSCSLHPLPLLLLCPPPPPLPRPPPPLSPPSLSSFSPPLLSLLPSSSLSPPSDMTRMNPPDLAHQSKCHTHELACWGYTWQLACLVLSISHTVTDRNGDWKKKKKKLIKSVQIKTLFRNSTFKWLILTACQLI